MTEENHSCCDCEYHAKANHVHVCSQGIQVTTALLVGDENCSQWEQLDVERRQARDAEIASLVTRPEQPKTNWELMEQAMMEEIQNSRRLPSGYFSEYPLQLDEDRMYRRHGDRIPYPMRNERIPNPSREGRNVALFHIPTMGELMTAQRNLPDPNTYSGWDINYDITRHGIDYRAVELVRMSFSKVELYYRGQRFYQWEYQGRVLMNDGSLPEMLEEQRQDMYWRDQQIRNPCPFPNES